MPRSSSPRKYKSHRDAEKYHKPSDYRRDRSDRNHGHGGYRKYNDRQDHRDNKYRRDYTSSVSSKRSRDHGTRKHRSQRHNKTYYRSSSDERDYERSSRRHRRDKYTSSSSERSRYRNNSDDSRDRRRHKKHYKNEPKSKHHHKSYKTNDYKHKSDLKYKAKSKVSSEDDKDRSKDAGHYKYREGYVLNDKYKIVKHLGDGTFGRVLEVEDLTTKTRYAMKVIRAVQRYVESAQTEAEILEDIQKKDPQNRSQVVRLETAFLRDPSRPNKEQNYFMIFEKLGMSLYDFLKMNNYRGFSIGHLQAFAKQILTSIGFMHSIGLTHTDLKPENILLENDECIPKKAQNLDIDERSSTCSKSEEKTYYRPKFDRIKIIDMGGATYDNDHHSSVINTRQYRAPEVMLACCPWSHESDVWSIGCILLELYTGDLFFETHETYEHLAMIDRARGPIPYKMGNRAESKLRKHFMLDNDYFEKYNTFFDWPKYAAGMDSINRVNTMKKIDDIIKPEYPEFRDLLAKMLTIDPELRIKCSEALEHDFFKVEFKEEV